MSRPTLTSLCRRCQTKLTTRTQIAPFSSTTRASAPRSDRAPQSSSSKTTSSAPREADRGPLTRNQRAQASQKPTEITSEIRSLAANASNEAASRPNSVISPDEPYHLTVYSHKHNCHITFTEPSRSVILSYSAGNLGLKKSQRKTFDAAYNLAAYTFRKMAEKNWKIGGKKSVQPSTMLTGPDVRDRGIEVVLRGYGFGREAFQKALLGSEGRMVKGLVRRVTDNTRLKFGGTRSRAVRRLG